MDAIFWNSSPTIRTTTRYIGSYKIAHWIRKHGYNCQVIDFITKMTKEFLYNNTIKFITKDTKILGISTTFIGNVGGAYKWPDGTYSKFPEHVVKVAQRIKQEFPNIKIILGGYASDKLYMFGIPDATVMSYTSPVEDIFLELLDHYVKNTDIPNMTITNEFVGVSESSLIKPRIIYSSAKNPKYNIENDDFVWHERDLIMHEETLPIDISRGCIFACRFCQYPHLGKSKLDYVRGMEYIKQELIDNYNKYKTTRYILLDDTFNDTEIKMRAFSDMTATLPFKITYTTYLRADLIDRFPDTAYMLKESGLFGAVHGLESLHPYASNLVGKAWSGKKAKEFIPKLFHDMWKGEVTQELNFIIGLPQETKEDIKNNIKWFKDNNLYSMIFNPLSLSSQSSKSNMWTISSEFERNAEKYGIKFDDKGIWYNETWKSVDAISQVLGLRKMTHLLKSETWDVQNMLTMGYSRDYILNTTLKDLDTVKLYHKNNSRIQHYFDLLNQI